MIKKILVFFVALLFFVEMYGEPKIQLIQDRIVYNVLNDKIEDIIIEFKIFNPDNKEFKFSFPSTLFPVIDFKIRNTKGKMVEFKDRSLKKAKTNPLKTGELKTIILNKNQGFSININLSKIYNLIKPDTYIITGILKTQNKEFTSNIIRIKLRKIDTIIPKERIVKTHIDHTIKPSEIITLMLLAEQQSRWDDYIKYFKLDEIIKDYDQFAKDFRTGTMIERQIVMDKFKQYLKRKRKNPLIYFEIRNEDIKGKTASIRVYTEYDYINFKAKYIYTYGLKYLKADENYMWLITSVSVTVLE